MLQRIIDRVFRHEEMSGRGLCPPYLHRWTLAAWRGRGVYVHHFIGSDWSRDMHDHPKRFISFGLWGRYVEETPNGEREYRAPWVRTFPAEHTHRIRLEPGRTAWTLVIVLKAVRPWGFWHAGEWFPWRQYVNSDTAEAMKSCP